MKRKILLIAASLALMVSGLAAVSAFESHLVNVTAHVENALATPQALSFGTVFPQEWVVKDMTVAASTSFKAITQTRVSVIKFKVCAKAKPATELSPGLDPYIWAGGFTYVATVATPVGSDWHNVGAAPAGSTTAPAAAVCTDAPEATATKTTDATVKIAMNVPVDPDFYNAGTDVCDKPRPATHDYNPLSTTRTGFPVDGAGTAAAPVPCQIPAVVANYVTGGDDFGLDIKLQVTYIGN